MGGRNREEIPYVEQPSFSDAFLFATMCIVGRPVDVHVKDGSIYTGIFHAASDEGIVLKKAKMTKKGKSNSNVLIGCLVETLIVRSSDLVQVVEKDVLLPANGVAGNIAGDELQSATATASSQNVNRKGNNSSTSTMSKRKYQKRTSVKAENGFKHGDTDNSKLPLPRVNGNEGQWIPKHDMRSTMEEENAAKGVQGVNNKGENDSAPAINVRLVKDNKKLELDNGKGQSELARKDNTAEVHNSSSRHELRNPSGDDNSSEGKPDEATQGKLMKPVYLNGVSFHSSPALVRCDDRPASANSASNAISSIMSASPSPRADLTSQSNNSHTQGLDSRLKKEFKLNPGAKVFTPTFNNSRAATPPPLAQMVAGVPYMPSTSPMLPAQTEVGIGPLMPHSTLPLKVLPYTGITDINAHPEPIARPPLLRYAGQYQTVPVGSTLFHPNSQPVMAGRPGQVMYTPLAQDLVHNGAAITPVFTRPLPTINQVQFPKHQGNFPLQPLMNPPSLAGVPQLYTAPSAMPLMQPPLLANRPITVLGPTSLYPAKLP